MNLKERIEEIEKELGYMDSGREAEALVNALEIIKELQEEKERLKAKLDGARKILEYEFNEMNFYVFDDRENYKTRDIERAVKQVLQQLHKE